MEVRTAIGTNRERQRRLAAWMAQNVIPHERSVRAWLRRARVSTEEIDELVQDCYIRFAKLDAVDHIERPDIYFFSMARRLLIRRRQREKIVPIDAVPNIGELVLDDSPSQEREIAGQLAFARLTGFMADLPERCRRVVEMRKFDGLSQREIAATLGVTENIVENDVQLGVRKLRAAWRSSESLAEARLTALDGEGGRA